MVEFTRIELEILSVRMFIAGPHRGKGIYGLRRGGESPGPDALLAPGRLVGQQAGLGQAAHDHHPGPLHPGLGRLQRHRDHTLGPQDRHGRLEVPHRGQLRYYSILPLPPRLKPDIQWNAFLSKSRAQLKKCEIKNERKVKCRTRLILPIRLFARS